MKNQTLKLAVFISGNGSNLQALIDAAATGDSSALVLPAVIAIIGFTATVAVSRFIEQQGSGK